ncbi:MAG: formate--tetrahydrofolate ligase, partial [Proteobacteria bacterium]|nr:formate--tetrahydrofolate ligase [Pseudomonadota bacterium]
MDDPIPQPIETIAEKLSIPVDSLLRYGFDKAKLSADYQASVAANPDGKLVLVTAVTPTRYGEGKTTTTIGLGDALSRLGQRTVICLREPSLGPVFGQKGGGTGGGVSRMIPSDEINLHFTGDIHAISAAHNLLAAMTDNHLYWGTEPALDARRIVWRRVMDMNDRALRQVVISLGGVTNGFAREGNFDITAASEIMAILCLATDLDDLQRRLGDIVIGHTRERKPVTARDLKADGAMAILLKDAFLPNLVQTGEGTPTIVHGGPFANIAHGCNSVAATRLGLKLGDIVVTEAGFGADLGAEKFLNIKARLAGLRPSAAVLVATVRALKSHGDISPDDIDLDDPAAVTEGLPNLGRHIENMQGFGLPVVVAINKFETDADTEVAEIQAYCASIGVEAFLCSHFADGGAGAEQLAARVVDLCQGEPPELQFSYELGSSLLEKLEAVATRIYRARGVSIPDRMKSAL